MLEHLEMNRLPFWNS